MQARSQQGPLHNLLARLSTPESKLFRATVSTTRSESDRSRREQVVIELVRNVRDHLLRFDTVAGFIEWRREGSNRSFARDDGDNSTSHTTLGGQANVPGPASRGIVKAGRRHCGQNVRN